MKNNQTQTSSQRNANSKRNALPYQIDKSKIFLEFQPRLTEIYLPQILKLQKAINFDELKEFETDFKKFLDDNQIKELKPLCLELEANILTFNVDNIFSILKEIEKYLVEE